MPGGGEARATGGVVPQSGHEVDWIGAGEKRRVAGVAGDDRTRSSS